jgi:UDP-N-acetylglucosamine enolpyruvyl transferase
LEVNSNLLQITTIPISIEIKVTNAKYEYPDATERQPKVNVTNTQGGYVMKADPIKVNIDTYQARKSLGYGHMNDGDMMAQKAQEGFSLAFQGTARVASEGNMLARGMSASEIAIQNARAGATVETIMEFLPKEGADITFDGGTLSIDYQMGEQDIDWETMNQLPMEFVPGSVELIVRDRPRVEIEYLGGPIYFPRSADPEYKPPVLDVKG